MPISLHANIARPDEAAHVVEHHLDGIGLLRTEFLFLDAVEPPTVDFQYEVYRHIVEAVNGKPVVVRTLDVADDKRPRFANRPFRRQTLAFRGLRFSLKEHDLFYSQVAAVARLARNRDVRILLPMVVDARDVAQALDIVSECADREGLKRRLPLGIMIETPAAAVLVDRLLEKADFVSVGTNDLTQYMLAADRGSADVDDDFSILHPALLRTIGHLAGACSSAGKPISVCGEAGGDPQAACLLAGLGIRQLSMSPVRAARVRQTLRAHAMSELEQLATEASECATTSEVRHLLADRLPVEPPNPRRDDTLVAQRAAS